MPSTDTNLAVVNAGIAIAALALAAAAREHHVGDGPPLVGVIMGSKSDWDTMREAAAILDHFAPDPADERDGCGVGCLFIAAPDQAGGGEGGGFGHAAEAEGQETILELRFF